MDWSEESNDIQPTPAWCIAMASTSIVALLVAAPCFSPQTKAAQRLPSSQRRRRRRFSSSGDSSTSSSQFVSVEDNAIELALRTVPAPARSTVSLARRSQIMEHQHGSSNSTAVRSPSTAPTPMSQAAGSALEEIETELDEDEQEEHAQMNRNRFRHNRLFYDEDEEISVMPPLHPDEVAPEDAADAHDIGILFPPYYNHNNTRQNAAATSTTTWQTWSDLLLDIADPFFETRRIINAAVPTCLGHLVLPLQQSCLAIVIAEFLNTESALAYILVELLLRITVDNASATLCDAHANVLQEQQQFSLSSTLPLALCLQVVLLAPILVIWYFGMEGTLQWLLGDPVLADIARRYTSVMLWEHLVRSLTRGFVHPFRWTIQYQMSLVEFIVSSASILFIVGIRPESLWVVGMVQLSATIICAVVKVYFITTQAWFQPYRQGLTERLVLLDGSVISAFRRQMGPLLISTILELGEWDILIVLVRRLGRSEVATWAVLSLFWECFSSITQGLGDAVSARVNEYLSTGFHQEAILISRKTIFFGYILAGSAGSFFLLFATGIANVLTFDKSLREQITDTSGLFSLAASAKIFSQLYCHLASAQGRVGLATLGTLASKWLFMLPVSLLLVFAFRLDLRSILLVIGAGYAGSTLVLGYHIFRTDWAELSRVTREQAEEAFEEGEELYDDDDLDDDYSFDEPASDDETEKGPCAWEDEATDVDNYTPETQGSTPAHERSDDESEGSDDAGGYLPRDFEGKGEFDRFTPALV